MRRRLKTICEPTIVLFEGEYDDQWGMSDEEYLDFWLRAEDFTLIIDYKDGSREIIPMHFIDWGDGNMSLVPRNQLDKQPTISFRMRGVENE